MSLDNGVSNGQTADENTFDNAFMKSNGDTGTVGRTDLTNTLPESGTSVINAQKEINNLFTFLGALKNQLIGYIPTFTNSNGFTAGQSVYARAEALSAKFHEFTGHKHTGVAGDAPKVESADLNNVPLRGYPAQGQNITTPGTNSTDVSLLMAGKVNSTGSAVKGVVVTAPYNKVPLFVLNGSEANDFLQDALGNHVYGRLTYSAGVWTLTTYVDLSGVETAYALTAGQITDGIKWFYQELFNPIVDAPVYDELFFVQSDNATADVVDATTTQRGLINTLAQSFAGIKSFIAGVKTDTVDEVTLNAGVTIDGVLLKDGLTDGRDVSADWTTTSAHIANVSNPHAVTKAQVGLNNVTDDAQLKRAAGDINTFTEKTTLVNDDIFLIEDSADSFNKKKVKKSNLGTAAQARILLKVWHNSGQALPSSTTTTLLYNNIESDPNSIYNSGNGRITPNRIGTGTIHVKSLTASVVTGVNFTTFGMIFKNGVLYKYLDYKTESYLGAANWTIGQGSCTFKADSLTDYFDVRLFQNSGTAMSIYTGSDAKNFTWLDFTME